MIDPSCGGSRMFFLPPPFRFLVISGQDIFCILLLRSYYYLHTAIKIIDGYEGSIPFAQWQKNFFKSDKKYGSKDRKIVSDLCFGYFRLGHALPHLSLEERLLTGLFLTTNKSGIILKELKEEWNEKAGLPLADKISL